VFTRKRKRGEILEKGENEGKTTRQLEGKAHKTNGKPFPLEKGVSDRIGRKGNKRRDI